MKLSANRAYMLRELSALLSAYYGFSVIVLPFRDCYSWTAGASRSNGSWSGLAVDVERWRGEVAKAVELAGNRINAVETERAAAIAAANAKADAAVKEHTERAERCRAYLAGVKP